MEVKVWLRGLHCEFKYKKKCDIEKQEVKQLVTVYQGTKFGE